MFIIVRSVGPPTDRPVTAGPARGRRSVRWNHLFQRVFINHSHQIFGETDEEIVSVSGPRFITQFPYKSCQRSNTPRKVTGHHWPNNKPPDTVPKRRVSLKRKKYAGEALFLLIQSKRSKDLFLCVSTCILSTCSLAHGTPRTDRPKGHQRLRIQKLQRGI